MTLHIKSPFSCIDQTCINTVFTPKTSFYIYLLPIITSNFHQTTLNPFSFVLERLIFQFSCLNFFLHLKTHLDLSMLVLHVVEPPIFSNIFCPFCVCLSFFSSISNVSENSDIPIFFLYLPFDIKNPDKLSFPSPIYFTCSHNPIQKNPAAP